MIFIVFGGVYVTADNVPSYLKWLPRTSMIKYAYEGLCVNEFRGMDFETSGLSGDLATGDQARTPFPPHTSPCINLMG